LTTILKKTEDIEVEHLATVPDGTTEFKVKIQKDEIQEVIVFKCKTEPYDSSKYTL
jgi:hypothetical protein